MSVESCAVVTIETENGPVEINESDFNPEIHKLADLSESKPAPINPSTVTEPPPVINPADSSDETDSDDGEGVEGDSTDAETTGGEITDEITPLSDVGAPTETVDL